jgi:hypothetical protein
VLLLGFAAPHTNAADARPRTFDVAVYTGQAIELYDVGSKSSIAIPCKIPVEYLSVAPSGHFLVISSRASEAGMGQLYLLNVAAGSFRQLTSKPFYFKALGPGERELYSDPEVSPDSRSVAFAVHAVAGNDSDDLVGLAGPLAVMNIHSGERRVLRATENVAGQGTAYVNSPAWSSDGRRLLVAFEAGGAVAGLEGRDLQLLDGLMMKPFSEGVTSPLGWWSSTEIFFVWNPEQISGLGKLFLLNLREGGIRNATDALQVPDAYLRDVTGIDVNSRFSLVRHGSDAELFSRSGQLIRRWPTCKARLRPSSAAL